MNLIGIDTVRSVSYRPYQSILCRSALLVGASSPNSANM
jgi:hypothetical protein